MKTVVDHLVQRNFSLQSTRFDFLLNGCGDADVENAPVERKGLPVFVVTGGSCFSVEADVFPKRSDPIVAVLAGMPDVALIRPLN